MEDENEFDVFDSKIGIRILIYLFSKEKTIAGKISRDLNITYSYVTSYLNILKDNNYIEKISKDKRTNYILLTEKGKEIAKRLFEIDELK